MLSDTEETGNCEQDAQEKLETTTMRVKVYKRRFWMLFLFSSLSLLCGIMYPLYTITADVTKCYYSVSQEAVNWTGLLYMVVYIILFVPVSSSVHKIGLRKTVLCISLFNTIASACQFATLKPNNFGYVMVSQFLGSLANVSVLALPPVLAAVWFPNRQLSRACAFGVFSNQMGVGLGFLLTPFMVSSDCSKPELIEEGKFKVAVTLSVLNITVLSLISFTFQKEPLYPPSEAQEFKENS
ncbi:putative MFS-type transporter, partial [Stegodyphus mimosarum]